MFRRTWYRTLRPVTLFAALLAAAIPGYPQDRAQVSKKPHPLKSASPYTDQEFQPSAQLPPNYWGNDIAKAYEKASPSPKGEFETSDAYQARVARSTRPRPYAFRIESLDAKYDADRRPAPGFEVSLPLDEKRAAIIVRKVRNTEKYVGSNAFGAQTEVTKFYVQQYEIIPNNRPLHFSKGSTLDEGGAIGDTLATARYSAFLAIGPEAARGLKDRLRALVICKIEGVGGDLTESTLDSKDPTFTDPTGLLLERRYLKATVTELLLYDSKTGQVLLRDTVRPGEEGTIR
jgi:hypothetical protein